MKIAQVEFSIIFHYVHQHNNINDADGEEKKNKKMKRN